jgi:glutamine amidotransferase
MKRVAILDYGSGNLHSAARAVARVGADVSVTADPYEALDADGLVVPGVGAFEACARQLRAIKGERIIGKRLAGSRPVLGICVGMQIMFERSTEFGAQTEGVGEWPGTVERLDADVLPHMGWNTVEPPEGSLLFDGIDAGTRFYFVHSYAAQKWELDDSEFFHPAKLTWARHGVPFLAAVENGPLCATQFHPEKSGDAGAHLLRNWVGAL